MNSKKAKSIRREAEVMVNGFPGVLKKVNRIAKKVYLKERAKP